MELQGSNWRKTPELCWFRCSWEEHLLCPFPELPPFCGTGSSAVREEEQRNLRGTKNSKLCSSRPALDHQRHQWSVFWRNGNPTCAVEDSVFPNQNTKGALLWQMQSSNFFSVSTIKLQRVTNAQISPKPALHLRTEETPIPSKHLLAKVPNLEHAQGANAKELKFWWILSTGLMVETLPLKLVW